MTKGTLNDEALEYYRAGRDYYLEVALGNVPGVSNLFLTATSNTIGTTYTDVWDAGGVMDFPTSAETWEIVSDSANDTSAGTGARTVLITSLDDNYDEQTEVATLNGTTAVTLTNSYFRPRSAVVATVGSNGVNVGNITIRVSSGGNTRLYIPADEGATNSSHFTIPRGKTVYPIQFTYLVPKNEDVIVRPRNRLFGTDTSWLSNATTPLYQGCCTTKIQATGGFPEKTDALFQAKSTNTNVSLTILAEYLLVDNDRGIT